VLVIFDFDGTIADTWDWMARELIGCAPRFASNLIDRPGLERLRGLDTSEVLARLGVPLEKLPPLVGHLRDRAEGAADGFRLFDGMVGLLRDLHDRGDVSALVSSNSGATAERALGGEMAKLFTFRRCGAGTFDKAAVFGEIVDEAGCLHEDAVSIGDEIRDLDAAAQAGIASIAVSWGYASADLLRSRAGARTVDTVAELAHTIEAMRSRPTVDPI
jgi:phosphoglycolate phosphatase